MAVAMTMTMTVAVTVAMTVTVAMAMAMRMRVSYGSGGWQGSRSRSCHARRSKRGQVTQRRPIRQTRGSAVEVPRRSPMLASWSIAPIIAEGVARRRCSNWS